jgi:hypothetical protein
MYCCVTKATKRKKEGGEKMKDVQERSETTFKNQKKKEK